MTAEGTASRITGILRYLAKRGIARRHQRPVRRSHGTFTTVSFPGAENISVALRNRDYREIYRHFLQNRMYTAVMLNNAIMQIMYRFRGSELAGHRLAFFAAPDLNEFQNVPDWYRHDEPFIDMMATATAPVLLGFDYDAADERHRSVVHPKSHLTIGRYEHCRIPVAAPLTPYRFMDFVLRHFYDTKGASYSSELPRSTSRFNESIDVAERQVLHLVVPS